jgi:hypothetical protein
MKSLKNRYLLVLLLAIAAVGQSGCMKIFGLEPQKDYDYHPITLDNNINVTARKFLEDRAAGTGIATSSTDTIFKYMKAGLDYAGIDLAEFEKADRTYLLLTNDGIRVLPTKTTSGVVTTTSNIPTAGLWFDFQIVTSVNPTTGVPVTRPATKWSDYPKDDVKNYFLYLIGQGRYNFYDLNAANKPIQSLLAPGTALSKSSMLGYFANGRGFDQEGKFYLKVVNNSDTAPIQHNNKTNDRSGGYVATNGIIHVFGASLAPGLPVL